MAKGAILLLLSAVCLLSLVGTAVADQHFFVEGQVYCDTCRAQFVTRVSENMPDVKVRLDCRNRTTNQLTFSEEATTDKAGTYRIPVDGDHEDDICEIILVKSKDPECAEINKGAFAKRTARISLTSNNGIITPTRTANPLGFMRKKPLPECGEVFKELGILPEDLFD
uniref:Uncharacterized protein n=1 Tax=Kalanchoe fedtschenkoi TaxID=63787 RepID=A0A7N0U2D5_KALFE